MLLLGFLLSLYDVQALRFFQTSAEDAYTMFHLHIPKCAGTSFKMDVQKNLPHAHLASGEGCYEGHNQRMMTLLRDPRPHVLSQYFHCRTSEAHKLGNNFVPATFPEWIDFWSDHLTEMEQFEQMPFCCYNPSNMMAARFSCGGDISKKQAEFHPASMQVLKERIANMSFVGIVEAYQESLCLLRIQETGTFPEECECATKQDETNANHGVKPHMVSDYSKDVVEKVDKLTAIDRELYEFGKKRFFDEIQAAEDKYQKKILCRKLEFNGLTEHDLNNKDPLDSPMGNMNLAAGVPLVDTCQKWEEEAQRLGFPLPSKSE